MVTVLQRASQEFDVIRRWDKRGINRNGVWNSANWPQLNTISSISTRVELTTIAASYFDWRNYNPRSVRLSFKDPRDFKTFNSLKSRDFDFRISKDTRKERLAERTILAGEK